MRIPIPFRLHRLCTWQLFVAVLAFVVGVIVRMYDMWGLPGGLNQDEALAAYESLSILRSGTDSHGYAFPLIFISWGSGMNVLTSYLALPFIYFFGFSTVVFRLPHLLVSIASLPIFYVFLKKTFNETTGAIGILMLAITPWHIMLSRWSLESNIFPAIFLFGATAAVFAKQKNVMLPISAALFGMSLYAYGTAYLIVPLYFGAVLAFSLFAWKIPLRIVAVSAFIFSIAMLPIVLYVAINSFGVPEIKTPFISIPRLHSTPRYSDLTSFGSSNPVIDSLARAKPLFFFLVHQNDGWIHNELPWTRALYPWTLGLSFFGFGLSVFTFLRRKISIEQSLFVLWLLLSVVLGLYLRDININRLNIIFFPLIGFAAAGLERIHKDKLAMSVIFIAYVLGFTIFTRDYFDRFKPQLNDHYNAGFYESLKYAVEIGGDLPICTTEEGVVPYPYALLAVEELSADFLTTKVVADPGSPFEQVTSFGRFTFGLHRCDISIRQTFVLRNYELGSFSGSQLRIEKSFGPFSVFMN